MSLHPRVYGEDATTHDIFVGSVEEYLPGLLEGYNITVFAYGATGMLLHPLPISGLMPLVSIVTRPGVHHYSKPILEPGGQLLPTCVYVFLFSCLYYDTNSRKSSWYHALLGEVRRLSECLFFFAS